MYSQRFLNVMPYLLQQEGGDKFTNDPNDAGGATKFGVSLTFLQSIHIDENHDGRVDILDIEGLDKDEATDIYWNNFWKSYYDKMPEGIGEKMFDVAVNTGLVRSNMFLQQALNKLGSNIKVDGLIGNGTITETTKYKPDDILNAYIDAQKAFYMDIVQKNPTQEKFLNGWINRANFKIPNS